MNWDGKELVGFKLHAPSRIFFHNVRRLEDGSPGDADRGNILTWEQTLADRRAGQPLRMEVRMGPESILFRTLSSVRDGVHGGGRRAGGRHLDDHSACKAKASAELASSPP